MIEELHRWVSWLGFVLGGTYLVTASIIFAPIRIMLARWSDFALRLVYCPACVGFWCGLATAPLWPPMHASGAVCILDVFASAFTAMCLGVVWGAFIARVYGDVLERELSLIFPEAK